LSLTYTVHNRVIGVALEIDGRELLCHPPVERVMQKDVCQ
jgi:hypothetical protein